MSCMTSYNNSSVESGYFLFPPKISPLLLLPFHFIKSYIAASCHCHPLHWDRERQSCCVGLMHLVGTGTQ